MVFTTPPIWLSAPRRLLRRPVLPGSAGDMKTLPQCVLRERFVASNRRRT